MAVSTAKTPGEAQETTAQARRQRRVGNWLAFAALVLFAVIWLIPLAWALDTALKPEDETTLVPITWIPPSGFTLESFGQVLATGSILRWFFNSFLTASAITALVVLFASMAAYAFSRVPFRGSQIVFWTIIAGIIIPPQILVVPLFIEMEFLGLVDTYWGVIFPQITYAGAVFIFKRFFDGIPPELEEAAIVDGASRFRVYWQIWLPLSRPVIAAVSIFTFVQAWNNFLWPFIVITNEQMMTIPVGLATVQSTFGVRYADLMASALLGGLPLLVVFLLFQRQIVQGIASSGLKG